MKSGEPVPGAFDTERWGQEDTLLRVAWYYYKDELTQDEIARRMTISRASVGRMLDRARRTGLVSITINARYLESFELSTRLRNTFKLSEVLVVPDLNGPPMTQRAINARVGMGGAQYLQSHLKPTGGLGVGWGDTVSRVVSSTDTAAIGPLHMVTLTGGVDGYLQALAYSRGDQGRGEVDGLTASVIPSPIVVSTPSLAAALRAEPTIQDVLRLARSIQCAVVGVGTATPDSTLVRMGYMSASDARTLTAQGVVGDILGQFFTIDGTVLDLPIHERRIGIELTDLANIDTVVGVAGGAGKVEAIRGALAGHYLDVLVTNEDVAHRLLDTAS